MSIKSLELKPTKENLIKCLKEDPIDRNQFLRKFVSLCNLIDKGSSIAIDCKWGDGKTFFVKQAKLVFDSYNSFVESDLSENEKKDILSAIDPNNSFGIKDYLPQVCVYYDAWINDNDSDPLLSIMYEITKIASVEYRTIDNTDFIKKAATIIDAFYGKSFKDIVDMFNGEDPLEEIRNQKAIETIIGEFLESLLPERGDRLIVIIDELDRCRPTYTVQLLERIKHYFDNDRMTFIFSINSKEMQHSLRKYYGDSFDACGYLDRFFDFRLTLPAANIINYYQFLGIKDDRNTFDVICKLVVAQYGFSMRETEKFFRMANTAAYEVTHADNGWAFDYTRGYSFGVSIFVPLIIGLKMRDYQAYTEFIEGKNPQPLLELINGFEKSKRICSYLLDDQEAFDNKTDGYEHVDLSKRLTDTYEAIFNNDEGNKLVKIGRCEFSEKTKKAVLDVASMLSENAVYD